MSISESFGPDRALTNDQDNVQQQNRVGQDGVTPGNAFGNANTNNLPTVPRDTTGAEGFHHWPSQMIGRAWLDLKGSHYGNSSVVKAMSRLLVRAFESNKLGDHDYYASKIISRSRIFPEIITNAKKENYIRQLPQGGDVKGKYVYYGEPRFDAHFTFLNLSRDTAGSFVKWLKEKNFDGVLSIRVAGDYETAGSTANVMIYSKTSEQRAKMLDAIQAYQKSHPNQFMSETLCIAEKVAPGIAKGDAQNQNQLDWLAHYSGNTTEITPEDPYVPVFAKILLFADQKFVRLRDERINPFDALNETFAREAINDVLKQCKFNQLNPSRPSDIPQTPHPDRVDKTQDGYMRLEEIVRHSVLLAKGLYEKIASVEKEPNDTQGKIYNLAFDLAAKAIEQDPLAKSCIERDLKVDRNILVDDMIRRRLKEPNLLNAIPLVTQSVKTALVMAIRRARQQHPNGPLHELVAAAFSDAQKEIGKLDEEMRRNLPALTIKQIVFGSLFRQQLESELTEKLSGSIENVRSVVPDLDLEIFAKVRDMVDGRVFSLLDIVGIAEDVRLGKYSAELSKKNTLEEMYRLAFYAFARYQRNETPDVDFGLLLIQFQKRDNIKTLLQIVRNGQSNYDALCKKFEDTLGKESPDVWETSIAEFVIINSGTKLDVIVDELNKGVDISWDDIEKQFPEYFA